MLTWQCKNSTAESAFNSLNLLQTVRAFFLIHNINTAVECYSQNSLQLLEEKVIIVRDFGFNDL